METLVSPRALASLLVTATTPSQLADIAAAATQRREQVWLLQKLLYALQLFALACEREQRIFVVVVENQVAFLVNSGAARTEFQAHFLEQLRATVSHVDVGLFSPELTDSSPDNLALCVDAWRSHVVRLFGKSEMSAHAYEIGASELIFE